MCPPLPTRSTIAQCSSRCCKCLKSRSANSRRRSPHPSKTVRMARSLFPLRVSASGDCREAAGFFGCEPVPKPHTQLLGTFHTSDAGSEFRTEQASVRGFIGDPPYSGESSIDRSPRKPSILKEYAIAGNNSPVERKSWLGAVPLNEFINGVPIPTFGLG